MEVKEKRENGTALITIEGSLLCEPDAAALHDRIRDLIGQDVVRVVIDLKGVTYINSCGLGLLISLLTSVRKAGGDLRLAGVATNVARLFAITHLTEVFVTFDSARQALESYSLP